jgi:hypothetical protein
MLGQIHAVMKQADDILVNRRDLLEQTPSSEWSSPVHAHVRGAGYYQ